MEYITSSDCVVAAAARAASCQLASLLGAARYRHTTYPKSVSSVTLRSHSAVAGSRSRAAAHVVRGQQQVVPAAGAVEVRPRCPQVLERRLHERASRPAHAGEVERHEEQVRGAAGGDAVLGAQQPLVQQLHLRPHLRGPRGTLMVHTWTTRGLIWTTSSGQLRVLSSPIYTTNRQNHTGVDSVPQRAYWYAFKSFLNKRRLWAAPWGHAARAIRGGSAR